MGFKRIKLAIDSDLDQVFLVGVAVNKLCSISSFSLAESYNIELCVVEAITNSIKHSYRGEKGKEVVVILTLTEDHISIDVCDCGTAMDPDVLKNADLTYHNDKTYDIENIADCGRGIGIMKMIMDSVTYATGKEGNCLTLRKNIPPVE